MPFFNPKITKSLEKVHIENICNIYHDLCDLVKLYNDVFGIVKLLLMGTSLIGLLTSISYLMSHGSDDNYNFEINLLYITLTSILLVGRIRITMLAYNGL